MMTKMKTELHSGSVHKVLADEKSSPLSKYRQIFIGDRSLLFLLLYECIILFFSWIPGAAGFLLRKIFYPFIFKSVGRGAVFGRNITLRHPHKIAVGDNTFIDDNAVLDAKGKDNDGLLIGKNVFIGQNTILSCKEGSIRLDDWCALSSNCSLLSESEIRIGKYSYLAGQCYLVAGGNHGYERTDIPIMFQPSLDKGGIDIGEDVWLGASVTVLDGVTIGRGSVIGAGSLVIDSLPPYSIAVGVPAAKIKERIRPAS
jgi:acetyltransferase-like isoleucine patch superfamily enzyme